MYYNQDVTTSILGNQVQKGGATVKDILIILLIPIVVNVTSYLICKWLDRKFHGD